MWFNEVTSELKGVVSPAISVLFFFFCLGRGWDGGAEMGCGGEGGLKHNGMDGIVKIMFRLFGYG